MTSYVICEDSGAIFGSYEDLASAQADANNKANEAASGNPDWSTRESTTCYVCIETKTTNKYFHGITCTNVSERVVRSWIICQLSS